MELAERLHCIEEIKQLRARYIRAADTKDWALYRSTLADDIVFDVSDDAPGCVFHSGDEALAVARQSLEACHSVHHCHLPEIEILSETTARGVWAMEDRLFWPAQSGDEGRRFHGFGHYVETYEKTERGWVIKTLKLQRSYGSGIAGLER